MTTQVIIKEFSYLPGGISVKLVQGFDNDVPVYYALTKKTGLNLPLLHRDHGRMQSNVLAPTPSCYAQLAEEFKKSVLEML